MRQILHKLQWIYTKFKFKLYLPFAVLMVYTISGAAMFRYLELEHDETRRTRYRESTEYAFNQVLKRMLEIRCMDESLRFNNNLQARHTKDALFWLIDFLNLTQVIEERSEPSPWTWMGSMFYAGQLYTTIGYGMPAAQTARGRLASMVYIMIGIPVFLIILKNVGQMLSKIFRKISKRLRSARKKLPDARKMSEPMKAIYNLSMGPLGLLGGELVTSQQQQQQLKEAEENNNIPTAQPQPPGILKKPNGDLEAQKQSEQNEKHKNSGNYPIALSLLILLLWIMASSGLFCIWEHEWGFLTSVYFFFVSISTVGLGDVVPTKPDMMLINFLLILIGLAILSMCITLIQFIDRLLEEYIEEIEKIAKIVTDNDEFNEETATPFEVGMTEMLTVPLTTIGEENHNKGIWQFGQKLKDYMAEQIATNLLINRLDPSHSDSSDSEESDEEEEEKEEPNDEESLKEVVVGRRDTVELELPLMSSRKNSRVSTITPSTAKDNVSRVSVKSHKKEKKHHRRFGPLNPFSAYSRATLRAIQTIETAKMRTDLNANFKSRIFAKFATNSRLTKHIEEAPQHHAKMVSFSVQTSPIADRENRPKRIVNYGVGLGSMDSFSSGVNPPTNNDSSTLKSFDNESLYSSAYYDVAFNGYETDSIPQMIAQNTPPLSQKVSSASQKSPTKSTPLIKLDRSSNSPPEESSQIPTAPKHRRYSTANCLPIPTSPERTLPILHSRMPMVRCPSCANVSSDNTPDSGAVQRVHEICGIMPSDFLRHVHVPRVARRPDSSLSDYENSMDRSFHQHQFHEPSNPDQTSQIPIRTHPLLRRSKRLDDSGVSADSTLDSMGVDADNVGNSSPPRSFGH